MAGRVQAGLQELEGMELDEDLALPVAPGIDALTHRISLARLQHVSNLAWCLGSWLPHLVSLAVLLIRMVRGLSDPTPGFTRRRRSVASEFFFSSCRFQSQLMSYVDYIGQEHSQSGRATEESGGQSSPQVHIRKLCGPGAYGGGASDYADGDTASIATSGPRAASTAHEVMGNERRLPSNTASAVRVIFCWLRLRLLPVCSD